MDNNLYFIDHANRTFSIYVMDLTTKTTKILLGDGEYNPNKEEAKYLYKNFIFIEDTMYYYMLSPDGLYVYQNGESKLISDNENIDEYSLFSYDGDLYYIIWAEGTSPWKLMKYNPDTEEVMEVTEIENLSRDPKIIDGCLYYRNKNDNFLSMELKR